MKKLLAKLEKNKAMKLLFYTVVIVAVYFVAKYIAKEKAITKTIAAIKAQPDWVAKIQAELSAGTPLDSAIRQNAIYTIEMLTTPKPWYA